MILGFVILILKYFVYRSQILTASWQKWTLLAVPQVILDPQSASLQLRLSTSDHPRRPAVAVMIRRRLQLAEVDGGTTNRNPATWRPCTMRHCQRQWTERCHTVGHPPWEAQVSFQQFIFRTYKIIFFIFISVFFQQA